MKKKFKKKVPIGGSYPNGQLQSNIRHFQICLQCSIEKDKTESGYHTKGMENVRATFGTGVEKLYRKWGNCGVKEAGRAAKKSVAGNGLPFSRARKGDWIVWDGGCL